jgi:hypothetical protein
MISNIRPGIPVRWATAYSSPIMVYNAFTQREQMDRTFELLGSLSMDPGFAIYI